ERRLEGRPSQPFPSDLRVKVVATGVATYPDVRVVWGSVGTDAEDPRAVTNPTVIVEVLSDSTEAYDRGDKFEHYRQIPTLQAYVLVSHRERRIETRRRAPDGGWSEHVAGRGQTAPLEAIGTELAVDEMYDRSPLTRVPGGQAVRVEARPPGPEAHGVAVRDRRFGRVRDALGRADGARPEVILGDRDLLVEGARQERRAPDGAVGGREEDAGRRRGGEVPRRRERLDRVDARHRHLPAEARDDLRVGERSEQAREPVAGERAAVRREVDDQRAARERGAAVQGRAVGEAREVLDAHRVAGEERERPVARARVE